MKTKKQDQTLILIPETDLVASRIEELRNYFVKAMNEFDGITHVILDVNGVDVVDSLGVNLIVGLYRQTTNESKSMEIIGANKNFMKVASFFRLSTLFSVKQQEEAHHAGT